MGADIYLKQKDGKTIRYFRDPYNQSSVMWKLNLSWWRDIDNKKTDLENLKMIKEKIELSKIEGLKEYIEYSNKEYGKDKLTATIEDIKEFEGFVNTAINKIETEKCYIEWCL